MSSKSSVRVRSCEEEDELQQSTKKVKESHIPGGVRSYRDKLIGEIPGAYCQAFEFNNVHMDEDLMYDDDVEELAEGLAAVRLTKARKAHIRSQWVSTIIVKVFGRTVGFHFLQTKHLSLWKPGGRMDLVDLRRDFFLIRFGLKEDIDRVIAGGPWFIGEHFLSIRP